MVRNVKREKGFSFVEILVSMVILAIVVLVMTNVLVTSTKSHSGAVSEDVGDMLALQKLAELQNHVIPAKSNTTGITTNKDNTDYTIKWEVDKPSPTSPTPPQAKVTVTWIATNGLEDTAQIVGYIDEDNSCPDQTGGNSAPNGVKFKYDTDGDGTDEDFTTLVREMPLPVPAHAPVALLVGDDPNLPDEDIVSIVLVSTGASDKFYVQNDTLKTRVPLVVPGDNNIEFKITDCAGVSPTSNTSFNVHIRDDGAPKVTAPTGLTIAENSGAATVVTMTAVGGTPPITWSISGAPQNLIIEDESGTESGILKVIHAGLNHEALNGVAHFTITATAKDKQYGSALCSLTVTDENDAPSNILLSNNFVSRNAQIGDTIGVFTVVDEDEGETHNINLPNNAGLFELTGPYGEYLRVLSSLAGAGNTETIEVKAEENNGFRETKVLPFTITISGTVDLCTTTPPWNSGNTYEPGSYVKKDGKIYKTNVKINAHVLGQPLLIPGVATQWKVEQTCP